MKRILSALALTFALTACVDTTGLSGTLIRGPHPKTNPNAAVTVVEFADLQCPACRAAYDQIVKPLIDKYGMKIRYDFMHFPLRSLHRYALDAAEASECAADQGKFWQFVDIDYEQQDELNNATLHKWAESLGLDTKLFDRCTASHIKKAAILGEYQKGVDAGVGGTPTFFVNGKPVEADLTTLSKAIDDALAGLRKAL